MFFVNEENGFRCAVDCNLQMCSKTGYQKCRFDVKDGEAFKVLKKIGETGRTFRIANEHGQLGHLQRVLFCFVLFS